MRILLSALVATAALPAPNLAHLDWLRREIPVPGASPLITWQIYATPVTPGDTNGPYRFVGDEDEGVGCVDDVARAAIVYARAGSLERAREALAFVRRLHAGGGTYYNFVWADGTPNKTGPTSKPGLNWWTARALWALAEGARVFRKSDPVYAEALRADAMRTVAALAADLKQRDGTTFHWGRGPGAVAAPGWFVGQAPDVTAVCVLGLSALHADRPDPTAAKLIARYGAAIAAWKPGARGTAIAGAHMPGLGPSHWHAYGAHMLHALAAGGAAIKSKPLLAAARAEADFFVPHLLVSGGPIAGFFPAPVFHPQIAYGVEPQVLGLLALSDATGEPRYAKLAALFGSWLAGANEAKKPMYDAASGRVSDGLDALKGPNQDAGAESAIEGLMAWQALAARPALAPYVRAVQTGQVGVRFWEAEARAGATQVTTPGLSGEAGVRLRPGTPVDLAGSVPPGRYQLTPVVWRAKGEVSKSEVAVHAVPADGEPVARQVPDNRAVTWPPLDAPWPAAEPLAKAARPHWLGRAPRVRLMLHGLGARQPVQLDGLEVQPLVEWRSFNTANGPVAVVCNRSGEAQSLRVPGFPSPIALAPWQARLLSPGDSK